MQRELIRIGSPLLANESKWRAGFDALFDGYHEFVYIADYFPWQRVNGTWAGALGHILNDMQNGLKVVLVINLYINFENYHLNVLDSFIRQFNRHRS